MFYKELLDCFQLAESANKACHFIARILERSLPGPLFVSCHVIVGMVACHDAAEVVAASDIVVAAVKPYMIEKVFAPLKDALAKKVVLSVAWTWDSAKWEQVLPGAYLDGAQHAGFGGRGRHRLREGFDA